MHAFEQPLVDRCRARSKAAAISRSMKPATEPRLGLEQEEARPSLRTRRGQHRPGRLGGGGGGVLGSGRGQHRRPSARRCARRRRPAGLPCRRSGRRSRRRWFRPARRSRGCRSRRIPSRRSRASRPRGSPRGSLRRLGCPAPDRLHLIKRLIIHRRWQSGVRSTAANGVAHAPRTELDSCCAAAPRCWRNAGRREGRT